MAMEIDILIEVTRMNWSVAEAKEQLLEVLRNARTGAEGAGATQPPGALPAPSRVMDLRDPNVLSELSRRRSDPRVVAWAGRRSELAVSVVTVEEIAGCAVPVVNPFK